MVRKMKNKLSILLLISMVLMSMSACSKEIEEVAGEVESVDASDYVTLCDYSEVLVTTVLQEVTEEDIESYIQLGLEYLGEEVEVTDRAVEIGDIVNINYNGTIEGLSEDEEQPADEGVDLVIGSGSFIEGFEEGLVGAEIGDTITLDLVFPDEYVNNPDIAGNSAVFEVLINSIAVLEIPELTDEVATLLEPTVSTIEEYRELVRELFEEEVVLIYESSVQSEIFSYILENSVCAQVPDDMSEYYSGVYYDMVSSYVSMYGVSLEDYIAIMGMTVEAFDEECIEVGTEMAKEYLVFKAVAVAEGIDVTEDEINALAEESMVMSGFDSLDDYIALVGILQIEHTLLAERVLPHLVQYAIYE